MRRLLTAIAGLTAVAAGCSDDGDRTASLEPADDGPRDRFTITMSADDKGTGKQSWTLTCEPAGGTHPDPPAACAALAGATDPFGPVPRDVACTEIYGGPAVATITGTADGKAVDATYSRTNGCEISRWDALGPVLPGPPPGQPTPL
ncbi:MAG TPA: SSI family serine proteinase inhibitor [Mycobacteriales bacterium]|nr:SSI family serine proteinase inhibitor [Mycobacteriales bacterium]